MCRAVSTHAGVPVIVTVSREVSRGGDDAEDDASEPGGDGPLPLDREVSGK